MRTVTWRGDSQTYDPDDDDIEFIEP